MLKHFFTLEWKAFWRAAGFKTNLVVTIFKIIGALYFGATFIALGASLYFILKRQHIDPLPFVSGYVLFYFVADLAVRFFLQNMPALKVKPLVVQNIKRNSIVNYVLGKSVLSFFNFIHWLFFIPFTIALMVNQPNPVNSLFWGISMLLLVYCNNFLAILIDKKDAVFYAILAVFVVIGALIYLNVFDATAYFQPVFQIFATGWYYVLIPLLLLVILYLILFKFFKSNLYLDAGLAGKQQEAKTENLNWLDKWGTLGTFLKNDIRLIKRNKRPRTSVLMSFIFIFYGLLFFTNTIEAYSAPVWKIFAALFVTGGFLFSFGQFVPSWDSAYYSLLMTQNVKYRDYLNSKWWLIVIATCVSTIIASFYLYFGLEVYLAIIAAAVYNIGINASLVMLGGVYIKSPIDLTSNKNAFGDKKAFNLKTLIISLPKMLLPMVLYAIGHYLVNWQLGYILVAVAGILGLLFKNWIFSKIEHKYQKEKYETLAAYKQN